MLSQLSTYGPLWWSVFLAIALLAGRFGVPGVLAGQLLIAVTVAALDLQWVQAEMARPDWDGAPDQDIIFIFGVAFRVVAINTLLLPVGVLGYWSRGWNPVRRGKRPALKDLILGGPSLDGVDLERDSTDARGVDL